MNRLMLVMFAALALSVGFAAPAHAAVLEFGDEDLSNTGTYPIDPKTGATLEGLATDVVTFGASPVGHVFPFVPAVGEFPGTDQIFVGSVQTGFHDGYSSAAPTLGPQVIVLDYSSLVGVGQTVATLTLGIGADDFQFPSFGQAYSASINGTPAAALSTSLNAIDQTGPVSQFFTIGVDPSVLLPAHVLTLSINQGGDGGDGWSVDFLTVGVTTVPEPMTFTGALLAGVFALAVRQRRRLYPCRCDNEFAARAARK